MAKVIAIGEPVNDAERQAIAHLRDHLPASFLVLHNLEIVRDGETFEVDIAIIAPHAVYLVDVKGTRGLIDVYGPKWYPQGRQPFTSPLAKLRGHAKTLKGVITSSQPGRRDVEDIYVDAAVLLTAPDASLVDQGGRDAPNVTTLKNALAFFQNSTRIPAGRSKNITAYHSIIIKALQGVAKPRSGQLCFGNWQVLEKLGGTDSYVEYRAFNTIVGQRAMALVRAYQADPYKPFAERQKQKLLISTAYRALSSMAGHPCIIGVREFFTSETEDKYFLVTEDVPGQALRVHIEKPTLALTLDQQNTIAADLLTALEHLHSHQVVHRNISPSNILVSTDGRIRLTGFDFARPGSDHTRTIAHEIVDDLEPKYMAPEVHGEPEAATHSSDIFSAGLVLYELFTGEPPFRTHTELFERNAVFAVKPSSLRPGLPGGFDEWLQRLCALEPGERPTATVALTEFSLLGLSSADSASEAPITADSASPPVAPQLDYMNLLPQTQLTSKYVVEKRLGKPGSFGVAYKVIDTLGDVSRAMKLVLRDRSSVVDRLKKEYKTLLRIPDHSNVVKVIDADFIPGNGPPFIVFEYIDGLDVGEMIEANLFAPEDALELAKNVASGLVHLHNAGVFHCDIKPRNLLWTERGAKIIDFNVAALGASGERGGGSLRYLPPDFDREAVPTPSDLADRDLFALGVTLYEALTGRYPWHNAQTPPPGRSAVDPREQSGLSNIAPELVDVMLKVIAPKRADRFASAVELLGALAQVPAARRASLVVAPIPLSWVSQNDDGTAASLDDLIPPNTNPYVRHLLTVYSQSKRSNAGTRGLDAISEQTYVETALDRDLLPTVLSGEFSLVIISGNAGDGKTAFLQKLERAAIDQQATVVPLLNGARFDLRGRTFISNYDGSQDEGDLKNDDVLRVFFSPFKGEDSSQWVESSETRLIAINEGRLVDFLTANHADFEALAKLVKQGLSTGQPAGGVAVVNLNLRSVVADAQGFENSIIERLVKRMTHEKFWAPCHACDIKDKCYAFHNAQTIQDETAGRHVVERLKTLYAITHLRGRLHITLRDLRSALAYTLVGTRDCDEIHELYRTGRRNEIIQGFYFNSWRGGDLPNADRLLNLLSEVDVADADDPRLDRALDFISPAEDRTLFRFEQRGNYDREILRSLYDELPHDASGKVSTNRAEAHRRFIAMARRRAFFERRDNGWRGMLPYKTADELLAAVRGDRTSDALLEPLLVAINRGEGITRPERIGNNLALEVRRVEGGSVRSYRLYPRSCFSLAMADEASRARFVEHMPTGLVLHYKGKNLEAELLVSLDVFEMLQRLNEGYRPSVEEERGYCLSLAVFKNQLGSAPYQEVLLSTSGHDFYRIARHADGRLEMTRAREEAV